MSLPRTGAEIREAFLSFFEERGHARLPSDSLIPSDDPTLLFTGAGMNQFKDEFLGQGRPGLVRATTSQKCLRVPDLENVGRTPRHHTFFEMLGNFSFGDYFKEEAIPWEWEFFTSTLGWDGERMVATVYEEDEEAFGIWHEVIGLPEERIFRFGEKENYWPAEAPSKGPNGPCGPCSELYFDLDPSQLPSTSGLEALPERFLEVGNFVFTQFNRQESGALAPLPQSNIDVGLGLERIAAVAQDAANNFETEIFKPLLASIQEIACQDYGKDEDADVCMRRIADHARAVFFCIADGATPGKEGRAYVVRKILRRAVRDGISLGVREPFLASLLPAVIDSMGSAYPELEEQAPGIRTILQGEEEQFREVFQKGIVRLKSLLKEPRDGIFPGALGFELHDTYGFPVDITQVVVEEAGLRFDHVGYQAAMDEQRSRARESSAITGDIFSASSAGILQSGGLEATEFLGWDQDEVPAIVLCILKGEEQIPSLESGEFGAVVLDKTPFYPEGGGQVGDQGFLVDSKGKVLFEVSDTQSAHPFVLHLGDAAGSLKVGQDVLAKISVSLRRATEIHHTATHLLHSAMKEVLGDAVRQAGSLVSKKKLRFDYTTEQAPTSEERKRIEDLVQSEILKASPLATSFSTLKEARAAGVISLFGEKYADEVRVVDVPDFSQELCGGTHVGNTGAIGLFMILSDRSLAAGVRRMEAVAGPAAFSAWAEDRACLDEIESKLKVPRDQIFTRVEELVRKSKASSRPGNLTLPSPQEILSALKPSGDLSWARFPGVDAEGLRAMWDSLRGNSKLPPVVLLVGGDATSVPFAVLSTRADSPAGNLAKEFGKAVGGGGGGRPDFAQGHGEQGDSVENGAEILSAALAGTA